MSEETVQKKSVAEKMFAKQRESRDRIVINGNAYEIRPTSSGLEAWAESCGHWYKITDFSGLSLSDCLLAIRHDANWKNE